MTLRHREWLSALALGLWLSLASVWPVAMIQIGKARVLWQPVLLLSLLALSAVRARRVGWAASVGQSFYLFVFFTLAGWLPWLRTIHLPPEFQYPPAYRYYLALYETALAALIGFQASCAASGRAPRWWPVGSWSYPLVFAALWLIGRAMFFGHWVSPLVGLVIGWLLWAMQPWRLDFFQRSAPRIWRLVPWGLFAFTLLVVFAAGMRIYGQLGADFPLDSDDGYSYYSAALRVAKEPLWSVISSEADLNFFSAYPPLMGLWFLVAGPHMPSWFLWQGAAAGLLALVVYWIGRRLGGRLVGLLAAGLVAIDHVMLHLMATLNMETFFIPSLYGAIWLWVTVAQKPPEGRARRAFATGVLVGLATLFRPTAALIPLVFLLLLFWERPLQPWRQRRAQGAWMLAGFAVPVLLLLIRHRIAWGHWTLGEPRGSRLSWQANYAWRIHGQHPATIGFGPWLEVLASDPSLIWREMIPDWWAQIVHLWTHQGFGQMDLIQGLNYAGPYRAALTTIFVASAIVGIILAVRRRTHGDLALLSLLVYFTSLTFVYHVINTRYRAPFIPALYLLACLGFSGVVAAIRTPPAASATAAGPGPKPFR